jgi:hypothetical protein
MSGAKGHFSIQTLPMVSARFTPRQLELRDSLAALQSGAEANLAPGLELVSGQPVRAGEPAFVESICEGAIRKRFWYLVTFILDLTEAKIHVSGKKKGKSYSVTVPIDPQEAEKLKALEKRSLCLEWRGPPPADPIQRDFLQNLPLINAKYSGHLPLFSRFISDFPMGARRAIWARRPPTPISLSHACSIRKARRFGPIRAAPKDCGRIAISTSGSGNGSRPIA